MKKLVFALATAFSLCTMPSFAADTNATLTENFDYYKKADLLSQKLGAFAERFENGSYGPLVAEAASELHKATFILSLGLRHHRPHIRRFLGHLDQKVSEFARVVPPHAGTHARHLLEEIHQVLSHI